jgi:hypothetical protein
VFFALSPHPAMELFAETWSIQTYRSRCGIGGANPLWGHAEEDEFVFRFAIPTHQSHISQHTSTPTPTATTTASEPVAPSSKQKEASTVAEQVWDASTQCDGVTEPVEALESLFMNSFTGPPLYLHCAAYHKTKLFAHHFMGRGKVSQVQTQQCCGCLTWYY